MSRSRKWPTLITMLTAAFVAGSGVATETGHPGLAISSGVLAFLAGVGAAFLWIWYADMT